jgi:anti-sigma factor RsiW
MSEALTCHDVADFLADYVAGELHVDVRARFDQHLAECPACVAYVESYSATIRLARDAFERTDEAIPDPLVRAILDATRRR